MGRLEDRVAIITGAGQGIGLSYAERFLDEGAKVVVAEINEDRAASAMEQLEKLGDAVFVQTDISDEPSTLACAAKATVVPDRRCAIVGAVVPAGRALAAAEWALAAALAGVRAGAALRALAGPLNACVATGLNPLSPLR